MEDLRLGRLLRLLDLVKEPDLERALSIAEQTRLPIGKILVMNEKLSDMTLKSVVDAQWMLRDKLLTFEQASAAIGIAKRNGWPLAEGLVLLGCDAYSTKGARLGELLLASDIVSPTELDLSLHAAGSSGMPLGRVLLLLDKLPEDFLSEALRLQREVRIGSCHSQEAKVDLVRSKSRLPQLATGTRLGEILLSARVLRQAEVDVAVQMSQANGKMFGEILLEFGWVRSETIDAALYLQPFLRKQQIALSDAARVIRAVNSENITVQKAIERSGPASSDVERNLTLYEFMRLTGFMGGGKLQALIKRIVQDPKLASQVIRKAALSRSVNALSLKEAIKIAVEDSNVLAEILIEADRENKAPIDLAKSLQQQLHSGAMKLDQALVRFATSRAPAVR